MFFKPFMGGPLASLYLLLLRASAQSDWNGFLHPYVRNWRAVSLRRLCKQPCFRGGIITPPWRATSPSWYYCVGSGTELLWMPASAFLWLIKKKKKKKNWKHRISKYAYWMCVVRKVLAFPQCHLMLVCCISLGLTAVSRVAVSCRSLFILLNVLRMEQWPFLLEEETP